MPELFFEDFRPGNVRTHGHHLVDRDAMVTFARTYDPQPFHVDETAAKATAIGRLIASGWYTAALQMRLLCDGMLLDSACLGAPGIEELKWLRPVAADDRLSLRETVLETRLPLSRPDRGLVRFRLETLSDGEPVLALTQWSFFARRGIEPARPLARSTTARDAYTPPPLGGLEDEPTDFDAVEIGRVSQLGSHLFTEADIIGFAREFDPQSFHVDPVAAVNGPFGKLAASGWHTGAVWMSKRAAHHQAVLEAAQASGRPGPQWGVSPGFRDLKWLRPVMAGDTIHYAMEVVEKRLSASRPGWGLVFSRNTGCNQHGQPVLEFRGGAFMAQRGDE